jgi:8-oxo-dGTP pyrophosphatase MutT (NUDIX family)
VRPSPGAQRVRLLELLKGITPHDAEETAHRDRARSWVRSGAPLHRVRKPDVPRTHLVSYFVVVDPSAGRLLLVDHRGAGLRLPTGGHVEAADADPWATVRRECPEELRVEAVPLPATGTTPFFVSLARTRGAGPHTDVSLWYAVQAGAGEVTRGDAREFTGVGWATPRQILDAPVDTLGPHLKRAVRKLAAIGGGLPADGEGAVMAPHVAQSGERGREPDAGEHGEDRPPAGEGRHDQGDQQ